VGRIRLAVDIDQAALVERCLAYVTDPRPSRSAHRELFRLLELLGRYGLGPHRELLELLAVEGGAGREEVATIVSSWLADVAADEAAVGSAVGEAGHSGLSAPPGLAAPGAPRSRRGRRGMVRPTVRITAGAVPAEAERLTPREVEVLRLVAAGQTNRQIAGTLGLSPHTVKRHVYRILLKLDLPTRAAAAAFSLQAGLV
jgi:DNA-binding CsgD family transcriptional regulator